MSAAQVYALVRSGDLPAIKIGGRGQWRVERDRFEEWVQRLYDETAQWIKDHPFGRDGTDRSQGLDSEDQIK
jgi:excisionase family DNA binding protein